MVRRQQKRMSDTVSITLTPESRALLEDFPQRGPRALQAMAKELDRQNELTIGYAQQNRLSGPRPGTLGVRTGRLRGSIRRTNATISGDAITGAIGTNVAYAAVHEYGFDGQVQVRSFTRKVRSRDVRVKRKITAKGIGFVRGFTRHMRMPARPYIMPSIEERLPEYNAGLSAAVVRALEGLS
jgi:phage gpG-like protein